MQPDRPLLTDKDLEAMGVATVKTLQKWRQSGDGPPFIRLSRSIKYVPVELEKWLADRPRHLSTSEYPTWLAAARAKKAGAKS
jgi:hypothetical protein